MRKTRYWRLLLCHGAMLALSWCVPLAAQGHADDDPNQSLRAETTATPVEIGVGGNIRRENPYQSEAEILQPLHVHLLWESRYVTEGRDNLNGDGLTSLSSEIAWGNLTFAPWAAYGYDSEYTEVNLNLIYGLPLTNQLEVYAGYNHIQTRWASENSKDNEVSLDFIYMPTTLFDILGSYYHSFEASGAFWEFALKREQVLNDKTVLTLRSILGANDGYVPEGHNGLNHVQLRLNLAYYPTSRIEIASYAAYSFAIDREPERFAEDLALRDFFWGGIGIVYHF